MTVALWIVNVLLALAFVGAGAMKLLRPRAALVESGMGWAEDFSDSSVKGIGALEVLGGLGLVLPLATGIAEVLTPLAAIGLAAVMVGAVVVHVRRHETPVPPLVLGVLSVVSAILALA